MTGYRLTGSLMVIMIAQIANHFLKHRSWILYIGQNTMGILSKYIAEILGRPAVANNYEEKMME
ncbi:MAG: hypothetical protein K2I03_01055 [Lachnospiraceae bacterium]|nr:hypothetical protein [Lachnospiraceae bacterium]